MPLYDYRCPACGHDFETLVRGTATPACPRCGDPGPQRMLSRVAAPGTSATIIAGARRAAASQGHFSHYSRAERAKLPK